MSYFDDNSRLFRLRSLVQVAIERDTIRNQELPGEVTVLRVKLLGHMTDRFRESGDYADVAWQCDMQEWFCNVNVTQVTTYVPLALDGPDSLEAS